MPKKKITTIGYEGAAICDFIDTLKNSSIEILIDVRELPLSRRKGFSKNILAQALAAEGIKYIHLKGLGDPKPGREAARAGDYKRFEAIFGKHMKSLIAKTDLKTAAQLVTTKNACLMCFECDHDKCHRRIVADALSEQTGLTIEALKVQDSSLKRIISKSPEHLSVNGRTRHIGSHHPS